MYKDGMTAGTMESGTFTICIRTMVYHFRGFYGTILSYATNDSDNAIVIGKCLKKSGMQYHVIKQLF
jgi:hypothetical protein